MTRRSSRVALNGSGGAARQRGPGAEPPPLSSSLPFVLPFCVLFDWDRARVVCASCNWVGELRETPELLHFVACRLCKKPAHVQNLRRLPHTRAMQVGEAALTSGRFA